MTRNVIIGPEVPQ